MRRALITGIKGFTGYYLAQTLEAAGCEVFGFVHNQNEESVNDRLLTVDLCNREQVQSAIETVQPQIVAHLAGISFVAHGDVESMYRVNIIGTRNLLEALARLNSTPSAVLLASSANIYGNAPVEIIDETVPPAPANDYAVSKLAMEHMARLWGDRLPIVITRPFNYSGVGQEPQFLLPKIIGHFQRKEKIIELGNIEVERDFSDVRMVVAAYRRLLELGPTGGIFNVCSGVAVSLTDVLAMMASIAGYEIEVRVNPIFVRANEVRRLQGDASRLFGVIGQVDVIPLYETLRWMYSAH